jgi:hypothetical protein
MPSLIGLFFQVRMTGYAPAQPNFFIVFDFWFTRFMVSSHTPATHMFLVRRHTRFLYGGSL